MAIELFFDKNVTDKVLFDKIGSFPHESGEDVILNFEMTDFIKGSVIPKLCCFAEKCKEHNQIVQIKASYRVASFLGKLGFWDIAQKYELFKFPEKYSFLSFDDKSFATNAFFRMTKEYLYNKFKDVFDFPDWVTEKKKYEVYVAAELFGPGNAINKGFYSQEMLSDKSKAALKTISYFSCYSESVGDDEIIRPIISIVHNGVWHSKGVCYFFIQSSTYKKQIGDKRWIGIDISTANSGQSIYDSLTDDNHKKELNENNYKLFGLEELKRMRNPQRRNTSAVIGALFFRKDDGIRGLYHIILDLAKEKTDYRSLSVINGNMKTYLGEGTFWQKNENDISYLASLDENQKDEIIKLINKCSHTISNNSIGCSIDISMTKNI